MVMVNPPEGHPAFDSSGRRGDRFENVGPGVDEWHASTDQGTSTWDLCEECEPGNVGAGQPPRQYENLQAYGFGSPNRDASQGTVYEPTRSPGIGGGVAHPEYGPEEGGGPDAGPGYHCDECGTPLTGDMHHPDDLIRVRDARLASQQWNPPASGNFSGITGE